MRCERKLRWRKKVLCQNLSELDYAGATLLKSPGVLKGSENKIECFVLCFASIPKQKNKLMPLGDSRRAGIRCTVCGSEHMSLGKKDWVYEDKGKNVEASLECSTYIKCQLGNVTKRNISLGYQSGKYQSFVTRNASR